MLLHNLLSDRNVILASRSPRRRQLMEGAGIKFTVADNYDVDELFPDTLPVVEIPAFLAELKSSAYPYALTDSDILITADTVVIISDEILGKPTDRDDAIATLRKLSGNVHEVITGVSIRTATFKKIFSATSKVWFREFSEDEIEYYIDTYRPYDKAGAYGIQEWIGYVGIERIEGSFYNVMGLPIQRLYTELKEILTNI